MDLDLSVNTDNKGHLQVEEIDDSHGVDFTNIVPLTRDTDESSSTKYVSGNRSAEIKPEILAVVKHEPDDVCWICWIVYDTLTF